MPVTCKKCGGAHPAWECTASPAKIAAYKNREGVSRDAHPVRSGTKFIAEIPAGTKLIAHGDKVIAAGPNQPAAYVTDDGLVPIKPKRGRPISDKPRSARAEYQRELMRKRRAAAREAKK